MQFRDKTAYVWCLRYRWDPSLSRIPDPRIPHFMPPCTGQKKFTWIYSWRSWQISGMSVSWLSPFIIFISAYLRLHMIICICITSHSCYYHNPLLTPVQILNPQISFLYEKEMKTFSNLCDYCSWTQTFKCEPKIMTLKNIFNNASLEFLLQVPHACDLCNPKYSTRGSSSFQLTSLKKKSLSSQSRWNLYLFARWKNHGRCTSKIIAATRIRSSSGLVRFFVYLIFS